MRALTLAMALGLAASTLNAQDQIAGYRRDGTGVFPDITPPAENLRVQWATQLPSWGLSSPIEINDKVYVVVEALEGSRYFPALLCLDGATGEILWDKPLNHLSAVPEGDQKEAAWQAWQELWDDYGRRYEILRDPKYQDDKDARNAAFEAEGYELNPRWGTVRRKDRSWDRDRRRAAGRAGFTLMTWRHNHSGGSVSCVGAAFATPVSDGKHIWSVTAWGGFFCHDLEGNLIWTAFDAGNAGEYCRNGRSPILWNNKETGDLLLISDITNRLRVFDAANGRLLWDREADTHTIVSPMIMTVDGTDILWAAGANAYRLPDGKKLEIEGWNIAGMQTLVKYDERNVVFFCGSGEHCGWPGKGNHDPAPPAAVRFSLDGETLRAETLWHGRTAGEGNRSFAGGNKPWMLYHAGGFYHINGGILDALTGAIRAGKVARGNHRDRAVPATTHLLLTAGGHVYGNAGGTLSVYTADGQHVSTFETPEPETDVNYGWRSNRFGGGGAFTLGRERIYVRSNIHLHAIGN